ncbi:IS3 family transposase [Corynebacterium vitaeruminis]|uniref:IS3 family transposase n=1 Tax=Corynebacterium vitaeruminis TaxID=38305 RepID=UPI0039C8AC83
MYGVRKMWKTYLRTFPQDHVARCTIERRMRTLGLAGVPNARSGTEGSSRSSSGRTIWTQYDRARLIPFSSSISATR